MPSPGAGIADLYESSGCGRRDGGDRLDAGSCTHLNFAGQLAAFLDNYFAVTDLAGKP